jgi:hypothetical protein
MYLVNKLIYIYLYLDKVESNNLDWMEYIILYLVYDKVYFLNKLESIFFMCFSIMITLFPRLYLVSSTRLSCT